jgi:hypothetical protein
MKMINVEILDSDEEVSHSDEVGRSNIPFSVRESRGRAVLRTTFGLVEMSWDARMGSDYMQGDLTLECATVGPEARKLFDELIEGVGDDGYARCPSSADCAAEAVENYFCDLDLDAALAEASGEAPPEEVDRVVRILNGARARVEQARVKGVVSQSLPDFLWYDVPDTPYVRSLSKDPAVVDAHLRAVRRTAEQEAHLRAEARSEPEGIEARIVEALRQFLGGELQQDCAYVHDVDVLRQVVIDEVGDLVLERFDDPEDEEPASRRRFRVFLREIEERKVMES